MRHAPPHLRRALHLGRHGAVAAGEDGYARVGPRGAVVAGEEGYAAVRRRGPAGAIIATLPAGCRSVRVGNVAYSQCGATYYQRVSTGYRVVVF